MEKKIDCLGLRDRPLGREANRIDTEQRFVGPFRNKVSRRETTRGLQALADSSAVSRSSNVFSLIILACSPELNLYNSKARKFPKKLPVTSDVGLCTAEPPMPVNYFCNKYRG